MSFATLAVKLKPALKLATKLAKRRASTANIQARVLKKTGVKLDGRWIRWM